MNLNGLPYALAPMEIEDIPTVSLIEQIVFSLPWPSTAFSYEVRYNPASEYLILRYLPWVLTSKRSLSRRFRRLLGSSQEDLALLGYGGIWVMLDEAHISTLALRPEWRGRGLGGRAPLVSLIERALARNAQMATLEVRQSNVKAQKLYAKYGFKTVGERKAYYSDNREDALTMATDPIASLAYQERLSHLTASLREKLLALPDLPPAGASSQVRS